MENRTANKNGAAGGCRYRDRSDTLRDEGEGEASAGSEDRSGSAILGRAFGTRR